MKYNFELFPGTSGYDANANSQNVIINTAAPLGARQFFASHQNRFNGVQALIEAHAYNPNLVWSGDTLNWELPTAVQAQISYQIKNPVLYLSVLDVEPSVNAELIRAAKDKADGMVRIQTFSWLTFSTQIQPNTTGLFQWTISVSVTSMKSIFFTISPTNNYNNIN